MESQIPSPGRDSWGSATALCTIQELAALLKVPVKTVYYWVSRREIPYLKMGRHLRFESAAVLAHFYRRTSESKPSCVALLEGTTLQGEKLLFDNQGKNSTGPRKEGVYGDY